MNKNVAALTLGVFFLSLVSIFARLLVPVSGYVSTFFGYAIVAVLTIFWILINRKAHQIKPRKKRISLLLLALGQLGSAAFYVQAVQTINLAVAGLLLYSAPLWIVIVYLLTGEERITAKVLSSLVLGIAGVVLVIGPANIGGPWSEGLVLGLLAGISYAISFIFARKVKDEYSTAGIVFWNHLIGAAVLLPLLFLIPFSLSATTSSWVLGIGISWTLGYFLLYGSLKYVKAQYASIIALAEPVFIAVWGISIFQEVLQLTTLVGGIILLANIYFINRQIEASQSSDR